MTARFLDAETRAPVDGVVLIVLREMPDAADARALDERLRFQREDPGFGWGVATSGADGVADCLTSSGFCHYTERDIFGRVLRESGAPYPGYGVAGIAATRAGYRRVVVEAKDGGWTATEPVDFDGPRAALALGDILLVRE